MPEPVNTEWLREPPGPSQINLHVEAGEDVTPDEIRAALDRLLQVREQAKVREAGDQYQELGGVVCDPFWAYPCAFYTGCRIRRP